VKIGLVSDIHLEFGDLELKNKEDVDVLVIAGDACLASKVERFLPFFERIDKEFPNIVYVLGNHEHYSGKFDQTYDVLKAALSHLDNINLLEREYVCIDNVVFLGATLWTDFNKFDPLTMWQCRRVMNDYNVIRVAKDNYRRLFPEDIAETHLKTLDFLNENLQKFSDKNVVVVTHHGPTFQSVHPQYRNDTLVNGAYVSDLSDLIEKNQNIRYWFHGHTHKPADYNVGDTRVICNPRGYWNNEVFEHGYTFQLVEL
jgi:predicted phosphodiesterase